ncbi:4Fe-4S dicluster protein [Thermodesulfitimonas autotrophica]|uniref:4Fe-4S dicluster protein n=1 Tax=Thermodesulfitimonas autotrophica TaxID=1894989 RepID=A0A3N5B1Y1_9THEO|nr:4Fe-4S dicluster domain-containing protein [Thermodesulfitimonas autotrophica]RPF42812.1 4Fe-4S dicluster protein [Thermodesulfitimonas autotrophica]
MVLKLLKKERLLSFLERLMQKFLLVAPVREGNLTVYRPVKAAAEVAVDAPKSVVPPKEWFFPQTEEIYRYATSKENLVLEENVLAPPAVLFGVRPCDLRSFQVLDAVFLQEPADRYYAARRENTLLIGMSCNTACPECFCTAYGISPLKGTGADIHLTDIGTAYLVEALTPKGEEIVLQDPEFYEEKVAGIDEALRAKEQALTAEFAVQVAVTDLPAKMAALFNHPYWEELSRRCLGCGICTYVCPTCHCFDITDENRGNTGKRLRCWDACLFRDYTLHTSGHNPRHALHQRLRNRFFHKLKYNLDRYGIEGCVGCGRCVALCPVNIDIREVIATVRGLQV